MVPDGREVLARKSLPEKQPSGLSAASRNRRPRSRVSLLLLPSVGIGFEPAGPSQRSYRRCRRLERAHQRQPVQCTGHATDEGSAS
jgi:hypothetical protein